jgi:hypothetical protein
MSEGEKAYVVDLTVQVLDRIAVCAKTLDVNVAKNEEEAENKAYMAVLNLFKGVPLFEVLECEIDESAEVE